MLDKRIAFDTETVGLPWNPQKNRRVCIHMKVRVLCPSLLWEKA
jgi:hypothetical protein